jgi:hypothetical protein
MRAAMLRRVASSWLVLALVSRASAAYADEVATPCEPDARTCAAAPLVFSKEIALPIEGGFDTGWIPANSPLQVHLYALLFASTRVDLAGELETSWPEAMTLELPPTPGTGALGIHYGVDIGAEAMVQIEVLGQTYSWTGPIPYIPQFEFQVDATQDFDPWAWDGVTVSGSTMEATLAQVSAEDFIGISIPGLDGGFELNVKMDLDATYRTTAIHVREGGMDVLGGPVTMDGQATSATFLGGPAADYVVQANGAVLYEGVLHLIPAFYIETIGPDFSIPIVDVPIPFTIEQNDWLFDPVAVHVPLPDITLAGDAAGPEPSEASPVVDFGEVEIGSSKPLAIAIDNDGEALLAAALTSDAPVFTVGASTVQVAPAGAGTAEVSFAPTTAGEVTATILVASNDPDEPARTVTVRGVAVEPADLDPGPEEGDPDAAYTRGGGCACGLAGEGGRPQGAALAGLALLVALVGRRRSAPRSG